jgi:hypothetical protein
VGIFLIRLTFAGLWLYLEALLLWTLLCLDEVDGGPRSKSMWAGDEGHVVHLTLIQWGRGQGSVTGWGEVTGQVCPVDFFQLRGTLQREWSLLVPSKDQPRHCCPHTLGHNLGR